MMKLIQEIKEHTINLAQMVKGSNAVSLIEKILAKEIEQQIIERIEKFTNVEHYSGDKVIKGYLEYGSANKIGSIASSNITIACANLTSLITDDNDKVITNIRLNESGVIVKNTFTGVEGVVKMYVSTNSKEYALVLGSDHSYYFAAIKYWETKE